MMIVSAAGAVAIRLSVQASPAGLLMLLLLYSLTIPADAGTLTSRRADERGSAGKDATIMAIHTTIGFGAFAFGAWGSGIVVDPGGGPDRTSASGRT